MGTQQKILQIQKNVSVTELFSYFIPMYIIKTEYILIAPVNLLGRIQPTITNAMMGCFE